MTKLELKMLMTWLVHEYQDYLWRKAELEVEYVEIEVTLHQ